MRWLVGVMVVASACGLSERHDRGRGGTPDETTPAAGADSDSDGGASSDRRPGSPSATEGTSGGSGDAGAPNGPSTGTGGTDVRPGGSDQRGIPTSHGGVPSGGAPSAGGPPDSAGAGGASAGAPEVGGSGGLPITAAAGGIAGGAGASGTGGMAGPISSPHALHFEGVATSAQINFFAMQADQNGGWATGDTFELWFRTTSTRAPLLAAYQDGPWGSISLNVVNGGLCFFHEIGVDPPFDETCTPTRTLNDGAWHHAAAVVTSSRLELFEDGALVFDQPETQAFVLPPTLDRVVLGTGLDGKDGATYFLAGDLDEVRVWSGARSAAEIRDYRATELSSLPNTADGEARLIGYFRLDESGDETLLDDMSPVPHYGDLYLHEDAPWISPGAF